MERSQHFLNAKPFRLLGEIRTEDVVAVSQQKNAARYPTEIPPAVAACCVRHRKANGRHAKKSSRIAGNHNVAERAYLRQFLNTTASGGMEALKTSDTPSIKRMPKTRLQACQI